MKGSFQYLYVQTATDILDIDDIANCYIEASNDVGEFYYMAVSTVLGMTRIVEYGPYCDGIKCTMVTSVFTQDEFNEKLVNKRITKFVNAPGKNISQARQLTREEFEEIMPGLINPVLMLKDN